MGAIELAAWVQAAATIVLVFLTWQYVRKTQQLVENGSVVPWLEASVIGDGDLPDVTVLNAGPGPAVNVTVRMAVITEEHPKGAYAKMWGPMSLQPSVTARYQFARLHAAMEVPRGSYVVLGFRDSAGRDHIQCWQVMRHAADCEKGLLDPKDGIPEYPDANQWGDWRFGDH